MKKRLEDMRQSVRREAAAVNRISKRNVTEALHSELKAVQQSLSRLAAPRFSHRPETSHLDCHRLFSSDAAYMGEVAASRIAMIERRDLDMSCEAIRWRVLPPTRSMAINFSIAFARIVHTDYEFLEEQLSVTYSGENHYCYHVDMKSPEVFKKRMSMLSKCLSNVYLTKENLEIDGAVGKNVNFAHMACLKLLENKGPWSYAILQQTHDVMIRTNMELKQIFQALNGANDVQITPCAPFHYDHSSSWDAEKLRVFHNAHVKVSEESLKTPLYIAKGAVQASLSRAAVSWINRVNLTGLVQQFNSGKRAVDEMLMSSLQIADGWEMPGRFTDQCLKQGYSYEGITRMVQWRQSKSECLAGFLRHSVCVLGTEDLPFISKLPHILINKMMPSFDYGAIACVSELLFNRTHLGQTHPLNISFYKNQPAVRFYNHLKRYGIKLSCQELYS
ncbi:Core-2/I-Branching enzyme [Ancylostoma duodenale]|uniref:Core-2/I-Branching enzyme n=1 Tax=Ancylostoma duodenale TaxID=51022 RepID=A0A0C2D7E0_9BILA|nr:Core-2/I-Branching enzyme [Ancylostoma duodenale]